MSDDATAGTGGPDEPSAWRNPFTAQAGGPDGKGIDPADHPEQEELPPEPVRAALVLPVTDVERVASALALAAIAVDLVPVEGVGAVAPLGELLQPAAEARAQQVSRTLRRVPVTLLLAGSDQAVAQLWASGARGADPKAGLLLATWPDAVLALLLGRREAADVPGATSSAGRSRWSGFWGSLRPRR